MKEKEISLDNPYLDEFLQLQDLPFDTRLSSPFRGKRKELVEKYCWAVPNYEAIELIVSYSPIIEIGAGGGYWAKLIREMGGDIIAYDMQPYHNNYANSRWTEVLKGSYDKLKEYPDRTLFICWPDYDTPFGYNCIKSYQGEFLIYIGEVGSGCTGCDKMHDLLKKEWVKHKTCYIPTYDLLHDKLIVYKRK